MPLVDAQTGRQDKMSIIDSAAGIWKDRKETINVRELRAGWKKRATSCFRSLYSCRAFPKVRAS
jgi:hypothetical protein